MKHLFILLLFILSSCIGQEKRDNSKPISKSVSKPVVISKEEQRKNELHYIKRRNLNVKYFKNKSFDDTTFRQENDSISALEKLLKKIVVNSKIENLTTNGTINLQTFLPEVGYNMLDGLATKNGDASVVCITEYIFSDFFKIKNSNTFQNLTTSDLSNFFQSTFAANHVITGITSFKIDTDENIHAYGMVSIDGQDIGPFSPNELYAIVFRDNLVYLFNKTIVDKVNQLEKCHAIWGEFFESSEDKSWSSEEKVWKNYCECYQKNFKKTTQFTTLKEKITTMLHPILE